MIARIVRALRRKPLPPPGRGDYRCSICWVLPGQNHLSSCRYGGIR